MPDYECCKFRGSIVALDAVTGRQIWKSYTIPEEPKPFRRNARGTQLWGPSGGAIWSSPVIDESRSALYVTTGNNYSDPPTTTSDAFVRPAPRPAYSVLGHGALERAGVTPIPDWRERWEAAAPSVLHRVVSA